MPSTGQQDGSNDELSSPAALKAEYSEAEAKKLAHLISGQDRNMEVIARMRKALNEHDLQGRIRQRETCDLKAELQDCKSELKHFRHEEKTSSEKEGLMLNDLEATQLAARESGLKIVELTCSLTSADHNTAELKTTIEKLTRQNANLKQELDGALVELSEASVTGHGQRDGALQLELVDLRTQLAAAMNERYVRISTQRVLSCVVHPIPVV